MKSLVIAGFVLSASMGLAASAAAQDPPDPVPVPPPPPPQAVPREVAVPRTPEMRNPDQSESRAAERPAQREAAETRRATDEQRGAVRRPSGDDSQRGRPEPAGGDRAVRRGSDPASAPRPTPSTAPVNASAADDADAQRRGNVRRPQGSPPATGRAVPRVGGRPTTRDRDVYVYADPWRYSRYYNPWGYGSFGLGYFYYSPWAWYPTYGYGHGYPGYGYPPYGGTYGFDVGSVRLKVSPRDAEVWVDGYYAGSVDDFDGMFQALKLDSGPYKIEIRKPGYETLRFDVRVQPERTITFRGEMRQTP